MSLKDILLPRPRPYWHVDAKWVCGLLLILALTLTLAVAALTRITDEKRGPQVAALVIGSAFVRGDEQQAKEEARQELAKNNGVIRPLPNFPSVTITEKDLDLSMRDIKLKIFQPIADSIYSEGIEGTAAKFAETPEQRDKFVRDAFLFRPFTKQTHDTLNGFLTTLTLITALLAVAVIYFSAGWGRLANPGLVLLFVSLPGSLLGLMLTNPPKANAGEGPTGPLSADLTTELGEPIGQTYWRITILALALLLVALIGKVISRLVGKKSKAAPQHAADLREKDKHQHG